MAHVIEFVRESDAKSSVHFWTRFFTLIPRAAVGHRTDGEKTRAVAVNWDADEESEIDEKMRADD